MTPDFFDDVLLGLEEESGLSWEMDANLYNPHARHYLCKDLNLYDPTTTNGSWGLVKAGDILNWYGPDEGFCQVRHNVSDGKTVGRALGKYLHAEGLIPPRIDQLHEKVSLALATFRSGWRCGKLNPKEYEEGWTVYTNYLIHQIPPSFEEIFDILYATCVPAENQSFKTYLDCKLRLRVFFKRDQMLWNSDEVDFIYLKDVREVFWP